MGLLWGQYTLAAPLSLTRCIPKRGQKPGTRPRPASADTPEWARYPGTLQQGQENEPGQRKGMPPPRDARGGEVMHEVVSSISSY